MSDIRLTENNKLLYAGPGDLEETPQGQKLQFETPESRQTWIVGKDRLEIISRTELKVRMQLRAQAVCPVIIDSPWGCLTAAASVGKLKTEDCKAEVEYELEGDCRHFWLEWTKE